MPDDDRIQEIKDRLEVLLDEFTYCLDHDPEIADLFAELDELEGRTRP